MYRYIKIYFECKSFCLCQNIAKLKTCFILMSKVMYMNIYILGLEKVDMIIISCDHIFGWVSFREIVIGCLRLDEV